MLDLCLKRDPDNAFCRLTCRRVNAEFAVFSTRSVEKDEVQDAMNMLGIPFSEKDIDELFLELDADGDESLTVDEFKVVSLPHLVYALDCSTIHCKDPILSVVRQYVERNAARLGVLVLI
eukprot:2006375-Pyramimonas_sp.AAC.1